MFSVNMFEMGRGHQRPFNISYHCYSVSMYPSSDKQHLEDGGKIIMPTSALELLTRLNVDYPMMFKLTNTKCNRHTHCGVLEFVADEGKIYIPYWMMRNLVLDEGDSVQVQSVTLPIATFSKFEPQSCEFLDISNQKAVLENALRKFSCLSTDDVVAINYNDRIYEMRVLEVKPGNAVNIIECDMNVEFAAPVGYQPPEVDNGSADNQSSTASIAEEEEQKILSAAAQQESFLPFSGTGARLDGKNKNLHTPLSELVKNVDTKKALPDLDYKPGNLKFCRQFNTKSATPSEKADEGFETFQGDGFTLRKKRSG